MDKGYIRLAVWVYSHACSATQSFWELVLHPHERGRADAVIAETNKVIGPDLELRVSEWGDARRQALNETHDLRLTFDNTIADEIMEDYWNSANGGTLGGWMHLDGFVAHVLTKLRPRPKLTIVRNPSEGATR